MSPHHDHSCGQRRPCNNNVQRCYIWEKGDFSERLLTRSAPITMEVEVIKNEFVILPAQSGGYVRLARAVGRAVDVAEAGRPGDSRFGGALSVVFRSPGTYRKGEEESEEEDV
ncbi:hypothetical protein AVEN_40285-1 [Araneus ventricosus]|uniref:Uncharacterized protein n=1 Tax=Araneus ventricosus TaxID=182803 RepID=A0A4Y2FA45_ARAVE|nr:hypothetical protein AVEN_40285-1 [Araneus ventricosus]